MVILINSCNSASIRSNVAGILILQKTKRFLIRQPTFGIENTHNGILRQNGNSIISGSHYFTITALDDRSEPHTRHSVFFCKTLYMISTMVFCGNFIYTLLRRSNPQCICTVHFQATDTHPLKQFRNGITYFFFVVDYNQPAIRTAKQQSIPLRRRIDDDILPNLRK